MKRRLETKYIIRRLIAVIVIVVIALLLIGATMDVIRPLTVVSYQEYTVQSGDTLWTIARNTYGNGVDIRPKIYKLMRDNGITDSGKLIPGQVLVVEVEQ
jgi:nucleoid-associated protein YgaU